MLLSRVASALYAMGRSMERAEHTSRVLDVHCSLALDSPGRLGREHWRHVLELLGIPYDGAPDRDDVVALLAVGPAGSIPALVAGARRAAQSIRPSISSEVWESINQLHWRVQSDGPPRDLHAVMVGVQRGIQLVTGLVDETMAHDDSWDFIRLGRHLERAGGVTRLVTAELRFLGGRAEDVTLDWASVLRSCSAFEAFRHHSSAPLAAAPVAGFLLLSPDQPRATAFCVQQAHESVRRIDAGELAHSPPSRLLGRLASLVQFSTVEEVAADPDGFAGSFFALFAAVDSAISGRYFRPTEHGPAVTAPAPWAQPQQ